MINIKLPGNLKTKKRILIILVLISIIIIAYNGTDNMKNNSTKNETAETEESFIRASNDEEEAAQENEAGEITDDEKELYNEAYNAFFAKEYSTAISKADQLINSYPDSYMGYNIRGIAKSYSGNFSEGLKDIDKSLSINSSYGYAMFNKALSYELHGDMDKAIEWYKKSLDVEEYVWSYYGIASIYGRKGDVENTMKYLNKAIEIDSNVKENAKNEEDFKPVMNSAEFQKAVYN